jgi:hypothetical protein
MRMFGFGIPGQGFYSFEIPDKGVSEKFSGLIVIQKGEANEEKIAEELKHLVKDDWDFQVKKITSKEYRCAFLDKNSIDTFSKLSGIQLALHCLTVKIIRTAVDPAASSVLQTAWIKVHGIPGFAKDEEVVREIATLVGEPIKVDEFNLLRDEPARVRINCRDITKVKGTVEIFFNGVGFDICFLLKEIKVGVRDKVEGQGAWEKG